VRGENKAVNISSFQDNRFPVIDSVWESESFMDLRNFILMADTCGIFCTDITINRFIRILSQEKGSMLSQGLQSDRPML
jgi:hypothetical protein